MIKRKTFLSYVKVGVDGLERVLYRTRITGERSTVENEKNKDTPVATFLDYHFDLIENKNILYPYLKLSEDDKVEINNLFNAMLVGLNRVKKNAVKSTIGIVQEGSSFYTYLEMKFTKNGISDTRVYKTLNPEPYGKLLYTKCGERYELIGVYADGEYGTFEEVIDWYSTQCGYDPDEPVAFILDGGRADTVFLYGNAGGGGAVLPLTG